MDPISLVAGYLGLSAIQLLVMTVITMAVCNVLGRAIPDDATGFLGFLRRVAKVLGLYLSNRVTNGVSVNAVVKGAVGLPTSPEAVVAMQDAGTLTPTSERPLGTPTFRSPAFVSIFIFSMILMMLSGCATIDRGVDSAREFICTHQAQTVTASNLAIQSAALIQNATARNLVIAAANANIAIVNSCPKE